jgi:hypothetical protein
VKLRARGNSLRLRVTRGELAALARDGAIEERIVFPGDRALVYRLAIDAAASTCGASFDGDVVTVRLPEAAARTWATSDEVGVRGEVAVERGGALALLIEKDFPCLTTRPGEDDRDAFPWPDTPPRC